MGSTHYFQRYSQKENLLTNNTLLLFQHFYKHDANRFEEFLRSLIDDTIDISIGPSFEQQVKKEKSVPDVQIRQNNFDLIIEAKPNNNLKANQLKEHSKAFNKNEKNLLVTITKESLPDHEQKKFADQIKQVSPDVNFYSVTYEDIILELNNSLYDHEIALQEILDDFEEMCQEQDVIATEKYTMMAVSTGKSYDVNLEYNIYHDPLDRTHRKNFKYLGLYTNKSIRAVGEVQEIVGCELKNGKLSPTKNEKGFNKLSKDQKNTIKKLMEDVERVDLKEGNKFFLVDNFHKMNYRKDESRGPIQSKKYMHLNEVEGFKNGMSSKELANLLDGKEWS